MIPEGLYQLRAMPFCLCNTLATFVWMMHSLLHGFTWSFCVCYLDDAIVFALTFDTHLTCPVDVLGVFQQAGQQLNSKKNRFVYCEITILGHIGDASTTRPDQKKFMLATLLSCGMLKLAMYTASQAYAPILIVLSKILQTSRVHWLTHWKEKDM